MRARSIRSFARGALPRLLTMAVMIGMMAGAEVTAPTHEERAALRRLVRRAGAPPTVPPQVRGTVGANDIGQLLHLALGDGNDAAQVRRLHALSRRLDRQILDCVTPDGTIRHDAGAGWLADETALTALTRLVNQLADTPFQVSGEAFHRLKATLLAMRFCANPIRLPMPPHGPGCGCAQVPVSALDQLARAGRGYLDGAVDAELAAAYLRLAPDVPVPPIYGRAGLHAEATPQGNQLVGRSTLMAQRHGERLALAGADGSVRIFPPHTAGMRTQRDGITTAMGHTAGSGAHALAGGLSHAGRDGIFTVALGRAAPPPGRPPHNGSPAGSGDALHGMKTVFFFDQRVVCLASDIEARPALGQVGTTLFETARSAMAPIRIDGDVWPSMPRERALERATAHTVMAPGHSGYWIGDGQHLRVDEGRSGDAGGVAVWLDHGPAPVAAWYRYIILLESTPATLHAFSRDMADNNPRRRPIWIRQHDAAAHVVLDRTARIWAGAFFRPQVVRCPSAPAAGPLRRFADLLRRGRAAPDVPVKHVSGACLLMLERRSARHVLLSIAALPWYADGEAPREAVLQIQLSGRWRFVRPVTGAKTLSTTPSATHLQFTPVGQGTLTVRLCRE